MSYYISNSELSAATGTSSRFGSCGDLFAGYNTFLNQDNWLRLSSTKENISDVIVSIYTKDGDLITSFPQWLGFGMNLDININEFVSANSYGLIEVEHFGDSTDGIVSELITISEDGSFDIATSFILQ